MTGTSRKAQLAIVVLAVLLLRLPFLNQAVQGDDYYYLKGAEHAVIEPLHPAHAEYLFQGVLVSMRGHPHPPGNAWVLGGLLAVFGDVKEVPFHGFYTLFSLLAAISAFVIAERFSSKPLLAALLFAAVPPFVVNGNSFESDLPFVAFWLAAVAAYLCERVWLAAASAFLAGMFAFQAVLLAPILFFAPGRRKWAALLAAPLAFAAFQAFERLTGGALPARVLAGYLQTYQLNTFDLKLKNAIALTGHLCVTLVSPLAWLRREPGGVRDARFLWAWIGIFFAGALVIFFAGSARYLLPIALPLAILVSTSRLAIPALLIQFVIGIGLSVVNYQHWGAYRDIAAQVPEARRVFVNAELGFRHYMESRGAIPVSKEQVFRDGDIIVSSAYSPAPAAPTGLLKSFEINSPIPLRIVALGSKSGYSSVSFGLWPFEISTSPLDVVRIETVRRKQPTLEYLKTGTPEVTDHALSGISPGDQWTFQSATFALKRPSGPHIARAEFYIPAGANGRRVTLSVNGAAVAEMADAGEGMHTIESKELAPGGATASLTIATDRPFLPPNDQRRLGVVLVGIGFVGRK